MAESNKICLLFQSGGVSVAVLYVKEQGAILQKRSERILISKGGKNLLEMPLYHIDSIMIIGNVQITSQALQAVLQQGIDVTYLTYSGKYLGHTAAETSKNIFLRLAQYEVYQDMEKRLGFAGKIVENKMENQKQMINRWRWESGDIAWKEEVEQIGKLQQKIGKAENTSKLMGLEGMASNLYFRAFGRMFRCEFAFDGRNRRPPRDPINVMISLGYTFLTQEVSNALEGESFEMYLGFLHGIRYGRKSLPLDLVEEFRQPVVDRMTVRMFNKRMIQKYDFTFEEDSVILNEDGFRKFCREFERWMTDKNCSGEEKSYRQIIQEQAGCLKRAIQEKGVYEPYRLKEKTSI